MIYKCKICGGSIVLDRETGIAECEYCGTKQVLPLFTNDSERLLYESGNSYLSHNEFDKAGNVFNQLLTISPNSSELYWDLVLCKYGVTYVKDPKTQKYIPTCNRTHFESIYKDSNYQKAVSLSTEEKKGYFEEVAHTIDSIQKGILSIYKKEKPFDIFISYKETDANGNRTKDSIESQKLYELLTEAGYKVFFSRITLEDKIGSEYEPYIYAALHSSKVMLTVCSSKENIEAAWVKNEWSRFLGFRQEDSAKTLIPLYFDMDKTELPDEFTLFSSYDLSEDGFAEELLRGIKKLIPLPIMKAKRRKKVLKFAGISIAALAVIIGIIAAIIIPKKVEENRYHKEYQSAIDLFESADYASAAELFNALGDYKDSVNMLEKCNMQPEYDAAMQLYYDGKYAQASWAFRDLTGYNDSAEMQKKCESAWRESLATVVLVNKLDSRNDLGTYFITANGSVGNFSSDPGNSHSDIDINEHGKIVSIGAAGCLNALYEDGYVVNSAKNNNMEKDWENVIQISPTFNLDSVVLKADGTVEDGHCQSDAWINDDWLLGVSEWKNIISLSWSYVRTSELGETEAYLVGIDKDGKAQIVSTSQNALFERFLSNLSGIKEICFGRDDSFFNDGGIYDPSATVLMEDGTIYIYSSGRVQTIQDIEAQKIGNLYYIDKKGQLRSILGGELLLEDVVYVCCDCLGDFYVTQSGTIYNGVNKTEAKTKVYDVWLAR